MVINISMLIFSKEENILYYLSESVEQKDCPFDGYTSFSIENTVPRIILCKQPITQSVIL